MTLEQIVGTILIRDHYRYVRYNYALRAFLFVLAMLGVSLWANYSLANRPTAFRYIQTDISGRLAKVTKLDEPGKTDEQVLAYTVDAVSKIYTFDFLNFRQQFQASQNQLTVVGWKGFETALKESGNFDAIVNNKFVTTAAPTGPARIIRKGVMSVGEVKRYAWEVEFPLLITYRSSSASTSQDLTMRVVVGRMPEYIFESGLGIRSINAR